MDQELKETTQLLDKAGFVTESTTPANESHFGNWMLIATRFPVALRVTNDRGVVLDLMEGNAFKAGANESDWFNWDVVARALGIKEVSGEDQLWTFIQSFREVENAFLPQNWPATKDRLYKIEAEKRRRFIEGDAVRALA
jgi:hypothetical protein